jgi:hypothetical protein
VVREQRAARRGQSPRQQQLGCGAHGRPGARAAATQAESADGALAQGMLQAWAAIAARTDRRAAQTKHRRPGKLTQARWLANAEGVGDAVGGTRVSGSAGGGAACAWPEVRASRNAQARVWT